LDKVDLEFEAGKLCVIVGASGSGKSTLLRILAGLIDDADNAIAYSGELRRGQGEKSGRVGLVFQSFALLDEFTPHENVQLALEHKPRSPTAQELGSSFSASQWLESLDVPSRGTVSQLSGGQKQRLAIARTLAAHPDILLYDEPTSGLDAWAASRVASLVRETQLKYGITSIVVTHDYASWLDVADEVFILDPSTRTLSELKVRSSEYVAKLIAEGLGAVRTDPSAQTVKPNSLEILGQKTALVLEEIGKATCDLFVSAWHVIPKWQSSKWGLRFFSHYLNLVAGPSAWFYLAIAGVIVGFVATYFTFRYLPYQLYTKPLLLEELLASIGFALYRILVPVLATILIAARCGAAVAADVGGKKYGGQFDALRTLGVSPSNYVYTPILLAFLVGTPVLTQFAFWIAKLSSLIVFNLTHADLGPYYWEYHFHRRLSQEGQWGFDGFYWLTLKTVVCGWMIAWVAYRSGVQPKRSSRDVSRSITSTVLWATLAVLVVHFVVAFWEFDASR
jgi:ABC-type lipoprotein export system ATPase subunit/ABC-type transporter Mla maintaining outer membrane lipid asymmetry permease subunit MlaE